MSNEVVEVIASSRYVALMSYDDYQAWNIPE